MSKRTCSIPGCEKPVSSWGWCSMHYTRWKRHGDPLWTDCLYECAIDGCDRPHYARTWCHLHWARWRRLGDPLAEPRRYASAKEAFSAQTSRDEQTGCLIWNGDIDGDGYGRFTVDYKWLGVHRWAWEQSHGPIPPGIAIDHRCHRRDCVEVTHLRTATASQNAWNRSGPGFNSSTGVRNVHLRKGKYVVTIKKNDVRHHCGTFTDLEEASRVAERERRRLFGEFAGKG